MKLQSVLITCCAAMSFVFNGVSETGAQDKQFGVLADQTMGSLTVVDLSKLNDGTPNNHVVQTVTGFPGVEGIEVSADGTFLVTANSSGPHVSIVPVTTDLLAPLGTAGVLFTPPGSPVPDDVGISPDGNLVGTGTQNGFYVSFYNRALGTTQSFSTGFNRPQEVAFTPDGNTAFASDYADHRIHVFDTSDQSSITSLGDVLGVSANFVDVQVSTDGSTLFATAEQDERLQVYDLDAFDNVDTNLITQIDDISFANQTFDSVFFGDSGDGPEGFAIAPDEKTLFIAYADITVGGVDDSVIVAVDISQFTDGENNGAALSVIDVLDINGSVDTELKEIGVDPAGQWLIAGGEDDHVFYALDISSFTDGNNLDGALVLEESLAGFSEPNGVAFITVAGGPTIPEPATVVLMIVGGLGLLVGLMVRRRRRGM